MMLLEGNGRNRVRNYEIRIAQTSSQFFVFHLKNTILLPKVIEVTAKLLRFLMPVKASLNSPSRSRKPDRNKKACEEKPGAKGQNKRNYPLKESRVTHILHLLNTTYITYGAFRLLVSHSPQCSRWAARPTPLT